MDSQALSPSTTVPTVAARLGRDVVPTAQELVLRVDPARTDYSGRATIALEVRRVTSSFALHAGDMELARVTLHGPAGAVALRRQAGDQGLLTLTAERPLAPGSYTLALHFAKAMGTKATALYRMERNGDAYVFTTFEPAYARMAFPCFDEPDFKIPFTVIVEVRETDLAISNAPIESETAAPGGMKTVRFRPTPPLPTYLVALAVGPLETVPITALAMPARVVTTRGRTPLAWLAVEMTPLILHALESWFGTDYPFAKLDLVAVPDFWTDAMEHPGAISFAESILLVDPAEVTPAERRELVACVAHELSHMWFGDLVTMRWWDDLWLNEAFAEKLGDGITEELLPRMGHELKQLERVQATLAGDARPSALAIRQPIARPDEVFANFGPIYSKGKAVLGMFERWMGADRFRAGVRAYIAAHAWGNAAASDLWAALSEAAGTDLEAPMSTFVDEPGLPLITIDSRGGGQLRLRQRRFGHAGAAIVPARWRIPIVLRWSDGARTETVALLLADDELTVDLGRDSEPIWVLPNADAVGYFRWSVPEEMLSELTKRARTELGPRERIDVLGNVSALLDPGMVDGVTFLRVLGEMAGDDTPEVVGAAIAALAKARRAFVPEGLESAYAVYVRRVLRPALDRFGAAARPDESERVSLLRPRLLRVLGDEGRDPDVRRFAAERAIACLGDPTAVAPALAGTVLAIAAIDGDDELFETYRSRFEDATVPADRERFLRALGGFRRPELRERALAYALSGPLRPHEVLAIPYGLEDTPEGRGRGWRWLTTHFDAIAARIPRPSLTFVPRFAEGCEPERLEEARAFFADPAHKVDGTDAQMARVADAVTNCIRLRERAGASVRAYIMEEAAGEQRAASRTPTS